MEQLERTGLEVYPSEGELLNGLRSRDRGSCDSLLHLYMPRLYRLALQVTGSPEDAEDVLQESFLKACDQASRFEGRSSLGSWLHRIVLNDSLTHLRKRRSGIVARTEQMDPQRSDLVESLPDKQAGPVEHLLSQELRAEIDEAILALPDTLRAAFVLRDLEGLSTGEAASALGISEAALKVRLHRARLLLRQMLQPYIEGRASGAMKGESE